MKGKKLVSWTLLKIKKQKLMLSERHLREMRGNGNKKKKKKDR